MAVPKYEQQLSTASPSPKNNISNRKKLDLGIWERLFLLLNSPSWDLRQTTFALQKEKIIKTKTSLKNENKILGEEAVFLYSSLFRKCFVLCQGGCIDVRNSRRGGVGFTLTDDRRVLAGPQNRRSSFSGPVGLSAPYQRDPVASRHTIYVHWLFRRHRTVWPLLPTGLKTQQFSLRYTRNTGQPHTHTQHTHPPPSVCPELLLERSVLKEREQERVWAEMFELSVSGGLLGPLLVWRTERVPHSLTVLLLQLTASSWHQSALLNLQGWVERVKCVKQPIKRSIDLIFGYFGHNYYNRKYIYIK